MSNFRPEVLSLYRRIIRLSKNWAAQDPANTEIERVYILKEARERFRSNSKVTDQTKIRDLLEEGNKRIEIACHYRIPYERPPYLPPSTSYDVDHRIKSFKQRKPKQTPWRN